MAKNRDRADVIMAEQGLAESRDMAERLIMAGQVALFKGDNRVALSKPGQQIARDARLELKAPRRFVSRGGYKLLTALEAFSLDVHGMAALDAGASTGGFTDCLLQSGAARVYAVDVGSGLLDAKLAHDARVVNLERVNLRHAPANLLSEKVDLLVADCSFISLRLILPPCLKFLKENGRILALVKPQFELGPEHAVKGVVRDEILQKRAVEDIRIFAATTLGLRCLGVIPAAIKGPKGNQEYLLYLVRDAVTLNAKPQ